MLLDAREYTHGVHVMHESHSKENVRSSMSERTLPFMVSKNNDSKMVIQSVRVRNSPILS